MDSVISSGKLLPDQERLVATVLNYNPSAEIELIRKAFEFANKAHQRQLRASGDAYVVHPIAVAELLASKHLDTASIVSGLLHDTVEDTEVSLKQIREEFNEEIYFLVDGLTKLSSFAYDSRDRKQAENFRKFILASAKDIRVLLVKLADKMHNMRTLHYITDTVKRERIARETMEIYAPLAERIGLQDWKAELDDLVFHAINPNAWQAMHERLESLRTSNPDLIKQLVQQIIRLLGKNKIKADVTGRQKKAFSIWNKMQSKEMAFERLSDIFAFRIISRNEADCYNILGILHSEYQGLSNRFKDYISIPKLNGYQSIHTGLLLADGTRIEVQIRTQEMNRRAEYGIAAHWHYKESGSTLANPYDGRRFRWLNHLIEILEEANDIQEFIEHTKMDLYNEAVFVFTPKGELLTLPTGATPIDFAYSLHTQLGHTCVGAKVNGRIIPIREPLRNGDIVEILSNNKQKPSKEWEHYCVTGKARSSIRRYLRAEEKQYFVNLGQQILQRRLAEKGYDYHEKEIQPILAKWHCKTIEALLLKLGQGTLSAGNIAAEIVKNHSGATKKSKSDSDSKSSEKLQSSAISIADAELPIGGLVAQMPTALGRCCYPIPGDPIVGVIRTGKGVTIHHRNCRQLKNYHEEHYPHLAVNWENQPGSNGEIQVYSARLRLSLKDIRGAIAEVAAVIAKQNSNISGIRTIRRNAEFQELVVNVDVSSIKMLQSITSALQSCKCVTSVSRNIV